MLPENQLLFHAGGREEEFLRCQIHAEMQSQVVSLRRVLHDREAQQEDISKSFQTMEHSEASFRVRPDTN